jgi:hypothetical protein
MHRILWVMVGALLVSTTASVGVTAQQQPLAPRMLPGTRPNVLTTIQGNALNSINGGLPNALMRLRDARIGRIVDSQVSDESGFFAFKRVDPGSYVVEIMGNDQTILAASDLLNVNAGEAISVVVKLPFRIPPFAGFLGNITPSAVAVTTAAGAALVLAVQATTSTSPGGN